MSLVALICKYKQKNLGPYEISSNFSRFHFILFQIHVLSVLSFKHILSSERLYKQINKMSLLK